MRRARRFRDAVDESLAPLGFRRDGLVWNRRSAERFVDCVMLQIDKTASAVTLEVGIADLAHHSRIWETAPKDVIATPYCFARSRLGEVVTGGDRWTPVEDPEAPALLASEAATRLPDFFDGLHSEAQLDAFLDQRHGRNGRHTYPPVVMYRALLKVSLGHPDLGCALLRKISTRQSAWSESVERLSRELGCVP